MLIDVDPEQMVAMIETVCASLETLDSCIDEPGDIRVLAMRAAHAGAHALALMADKWMGPLAEELEEQLAPVATDNPETCGHPPPYFDLPGQKMCQTCGASQLEDGSWAVL